MSRRMNSLLLGTFVLTLVMGCAADRTTAPATSAPAQEGGSGLTFIPMASHGLAAPQASCSASRYISAYWGGEIAVAGMRVRFPAGSLPSSRTVTLVVDKTEHVLVSLQPADLALRSPAIIQLDDLSKTDGSGYQGLAFYRLSSGDPAPQPTSNDWRTPQAWVSRTGDFVLGGTRWDLPGMQYLRYLSGAGYVTRLVSAWMGGTVTSDRFTVAVPPGALAMDTYITVRQTTENGILGAELEPHGLQFRTPVTLSVNLQGLGWQPYDDWQIYWLNDASGAWEDQGGTFSNEIVTGQLSHFSRYAPASGRAGW